MLNYFLAVFEQWYSWQTGLRLVQAYGRSVRCKDDWATTYVLDANLGYFISRNKTTMPRWFIDAISNQSLTKYGSMSSTTGWKWALQFRFLMIAKPGYATTYRLLVNSGTFENFDVSHNQSSPTTGAAGADEVNTTAALFAAHAQEYQSISAQAAAFSRQERPNISSNETLHHYVPYLTVTARRDEHCHY